MTPAERRGLRVGQTVKYYPRGVGVGSIYTLWKLVEDNRTNCPIFEEAGPVKTGRRNAISLNYIRALDAHIEAEDNPQITPPWSKVMNSQSYSTSRISSRTVKTIVTGTHRTDSLDVPILIGRSGKIPLRQAVKISIDARTMDAKALREAAWLFKQLADALDEGSEVEHEIPF